MTISTPREALEAAAKVVHEHVGNPLTADRVATAIRAIPVAEPLTSKLVEALREARGALHHHFVEWDGEPEDAVPLQLARSQCDAALAAAEGRG